MAAATVATPTKKVATEADLKPRLFGQELLTAVDNLPSASVKKLAVETGHAIIDKRGRVQAQLASFQGALLEAKGVVFAPEKGASPSAVKQGDTAMINGRDFLVLSRHHLLLAWDQIEQGQRFRVSDAGKGSILLTPID